MIFNAARRESRPKAGFRGGQVGFVENRAPFFAAKVFAVYLDKWQKKYANYQAALHEAAGKRKPINLHSEVFAVYLDEWKEKYINY